MLEEMAVVREVEPHAGGSRITLDTQVKTTCGSCQAKSSCGTRVIASWLASKRESLTFDVQQAVEVGQQVKIGIPEQRILEASSKVYLVPILVLMLSAVLGQIILPLIGLVHEFWVIGLSFLSAGISFVGINLSMRQKSCGLYQPQLLSILPATTGSEISVTQISL